MLDSVGPWRRVMVRGVARRDGGQAATRALRAALADAGIALPSRMLVTPGRRRDGVAVARLGRGRQDAARVAVAVLGRRYRAVALARPELLLEGGFSLLVWRRPVPREEAILTFDHVPVHPVRAARIAVRGAYLPELVRIVRPELAERLERAVARAIARAGLNLPPPPDPYADARPLALRRVAEDLWLVRYAARDGGEPFDHALQPVTCCGTRVVAIAAEGAQPLGLFWSLPVERSRQGEIVLSADLTREGPGRGLERRLLEAALCGEPPESGRELVARGLLGLLRNGA